MSHSYEKGGNVGIGEVENIGERGTRDDWMGTLGRVTGDPLFGMEGPAKCGRAHL